MCFLFFPIFLSSLIVSFLPFLLLLARFIPLFPPQFPSFLLSFLLSSFLFQFVSQELANQSVSSFFYSLHWQTLELHPFPLTLTSSSYVNFLLSFYISFLLFISSPLSYFPSPLLPPFLPSLPSFSLLLLSSLLLFLRSHIAPSFMTLTIQCFLYLYVIVKVNLAVFTN